MSVLNKKPYIQQLVEALSTEDRSTLLSALNGHESTVTYSLIAKDLSHTHNVESVRLITRQGVMNCFKIYVFSKYNFLAYDNRQCIAIYTLTEGYDLKHINEPLAINELRRYLESILDTDGDGSIDSGDANNGDVLTADGHGGASWKSLPDMQKRYQTSNIESLSGTFIEKLECGDVVIKKTGSLYHTYIVTHKQATGICLSYFDASCIETISYDKVGTNWTFNSKDVWQAS